MEMKNRAITKLVDTINKYHKELHDRPAELFDDEDRLMMKLITELKGVTDKYVSPKED